jgi:hypothetical protein
MHQLDDSKIHILVFSLIALPSKQRSKKVGKVKVKAKSKRKYTLTNYNRNILDYLSPSMLQQRRYPENNGSRKYRLMGWSELAFKQFL